MKILVFGNPALAIDNLALKVGEKLEGYDVTHLESPVDLLDVSLDDAVIIDVAEGIPDVKIIEDPDRLILGRLCSLHDLDMAFMLKLLKRLGEIGEFKIIALPMHATVEDVLPKVQALLHNL